MTNNLKMYISYEEPFNGQVFTSSQMREIYRDLADKNEYSDFSIWLYDMLKSGVFELYIDRQINAYETEKQMMQLIKDIDMVTVESIAIEQFIAKLVYMTQLYESDALQLMKEYLLYGSLSLNKYNL